VIEDISALRRCTEGVSRSAGVSYTCRGLMGCWRDVIEAKFRIFAIVTAKSIERLSSEGKIPTSGSRIMWRPGAKHLIKFRVEYLKLWRAFMMPC